MNLQTIRYRFSIFLKQFRIDDLKLLMKFLNEIVIEYKHSKSTRLFDLLSSYQDQVEHENFHLIYDFDTENSNNERGNLNNLNKILSQNDKLRRFKLLNSRKKLKTNLKKIKIKPSVNQIKEEKHEFRPNNLNSSDFSNNNSTKRFSYDSENNNSSIKFRPLTNDQSNRFEQEKNSFISYSNNNTCEIDQYGEDNQEMIRNKHANNNNNNNNIKNETKRMRLESSINRNSTTQQSIEDGASKNLIKCAVCNDSASGTRYGVCVCEGCKEFFRRQRENPTSNKVLKCVHGTNNCEVNIENRTHCRKCRLDKCLKLGMKLSGKFTSIACNYQIQTDLNTKDKNINITND